MLSFLESHNLKSMTDETALQVEALPEICMELAIYELRSAIKSDDVDEVRRLLAQGIVDPGLASTIFQFWVGKCTNNSVRAIPSGIARTALIYAVELDCSPAVVRLLLHDPRVDPNAAFLDDQGQKQTALMVACRCGEDRNAELVRVLLEDPRTDPNTQIDGGNTALMVACYSMEDCSIEAIRALLADPRTDPNIENNDKYFDFKIATLLRDKEENFIPEKSTINKKTSNIFGQITHSISENFKFGYDFAIDNDLNTFEYNDLNTSISINNFVTSFNFIKSSGKYGNTSILSNSTTYNMDDTNYFIFNTRRNRETNLTEYYDLVYEYKNDCLTAGIKYRKTYYDDGDVKPEENLLFTVTLFPLTTYEQNASDLINE